MGQYPSSEMHVTLYSHTTTRHCALAHTDIKKESFLLQVSYTCIHYICTDRNTDTIQLFSTTLKVIYTLWQLELLKDEACLKCDQYVTDTWNKVKRVLCEIIHMAQHINYINTHTHWCTNTSLISIQDKSLWYWPLTS